MRPAVLLLCALAACSGADVAFDRDAGARDGGAPDQDARPADAGFADAGHVDAGDSRDGGDRDGGPGRDGGGVPRRCPLGRAPIAGGGASVDALAGALEVFAIDRSTGAPVAEATVVIETSTGTVSGTTDGAGCAIFEDDRLRGAITLSVFSRAHIYRTLVGLDRDRVTLPLSRVGVRIERPARILGIVDGFDVLTASTASRARVGVVEPARTDVFRYPIRQQPRGGGSRYSTNMAVVGGPTMANLVGYDILVDARYTNRLAVWGGTIEDTIFTPSHLGLSAAFALEPDEQRLGLPLTITNPLDTPVVVRHGASTGLLERTMVGAVFVDGHLVELGRRDSRGVPAETLVVDAPSLVGPFAGASYGGVVTEWQQSQDAGAFSTVVAIAGTSTTVDVGPMPMLPTIATSSRAVTTLLDDTNDYVRIDARGLWTIVVPDAASALTVTFPAVPADYADPIPGGVAIFVTGLKTPGLDLVDLAAADPYDDDRPQRPDFARAIRRWAQQSSALR